MEEILSSMGAAENEYRTSSADWSQFDKTERKVREALEQIGRDSDELHRCGDCKYYEVLYCPKVNFELTNGENTKSPCKFFEQKVGIDFG